MDLRDFDDPDRTIVPSVLRNLQRNMASSGRIEQTQSQSQTQPLEDRGRTERRLSPHSQILASREPSVTASLFPPDTDDDEAEVNHPRNFIKSTDHISIAWLVQLLEDPTDPLSIGLSGSIGLPTDLQKLRTASQMLNNITQHKEKYWKVFQHMNRMARKLRPTKDQRDDLHKRLKEAIDTNHELKDQIRQIKGKNKETVTFQEEYTQSEEARAAAVEENRDLIQQVDRQRNRISELEQTVKTILEFSTRSADADREPSRPGEEHRSRTSRRRDTRRARRHRGDPYGDPNDDSSSDPDRSRSRSRSRRRSRRRPRSPPPPPREQNTPADTLATTATSRQKLPRIPDAPIFDGTDRDAYPGWKDEIRYKLINDPTYFTVPLRVGYVLNRTRKTPHDRIRDRCYPGARGAFRDYEEVLADLDKLYMDYDVNRTAKAEFKKLKMGDRESFDDFYVKFQALIVKTHLRDNEEYQMDELREKISKGLKASLRMQLDARDLEELLKQCRNLDHNRRIFNEEFPLTDRANRKGNTKATTTSAPSGTTNAYRSTTTTTTTSSKPAIVPVAGKPYTVYPAGTIGATISPLTDPAERQWLTQNGYCLRCRQQGHKFFEFDKCPTSKENKNKRLKSNAMSTEHSSQDGQNTPSTDSSDAPLQTNSARLGNSGVITNLDEYDNDSTDSEN
ncbi:MAG: hypothetical protein M1822_007092 [Bathelium mastoideum]|nr:MAG: hypothetical protein M1822_007092 [Bathelium mastoideum]